MKLDASDLDVVHADDYFNDVDYIYVVSDRICTNSSTSRQVPWPYRTVRDRLRVHYATERYDFFNRLDCLC
jgi:hypothetical protein